MLWYARSAEVVGIQPRAAMSSWDPVPSLRWVSGFTNAKGRRSKDTGRRYSFYEYAAKKP